MSSAKFVTENGTRYCSLHFARFIISLPKIFYYQARNGHWHHYCSHPFFKHTLEILYHKKYIGVYHEKINYLISSCIWQSGISLS